MRFFANLGMIWERFGEVWGDQNGSKNRYLAAFTENVDFLKIVVFPQENCYFLGFGPTNSMKIQRKIAFENIFVLNVDFLACFGSFLLILGPFWTAQNH